MPDLNWHHLCFFDITAAVAKDTKAVKLEHAVKVVLDSSMYHKSYFFVTITAVRNKFKVFHGANSQKRQMPGVKGCIEMNLQNFYPHAGVLLL